MEKGAAYIVEVFGGQHTYNSVKQKANKMGLKRYPKFRMSKKEKSFIRANIHLSNKEIAEKLNIPERKVQVYAWNYKLRPSAWENYSKKDENFIRENYTRMSNAEMAKEIERSVDSIHSKLQLLGLKRTAKQRKAIFLRTAPHTLFQKGDLPATTLYDGAITERTDSCGITYKYIRISKANWAMLHVYNWEKKYGPVPQGKILRCKDGNQLNCDPENWELVTRLEHLEMNSGRKDLNDKYIIDNLSRRHPEMKPIVTQFPELIEVKRQQLKLRRTINECTD